MENISMSELLWNLYAWFIENFEGIVITIAIILFFFCLLYLWYMKICGEFGEYDLFKMGEINEDD